jgi:CheY-like chemotaxis protein
LQSIPSEAKHLAILISLYLDKPPGGAQGEQNDRPGEPLMKTILVVDDDEAIRTLLQEELSDEGYRVILAGNALDALKKVEEEALDLVILDIRMPGMDGLEALPRILGLKEDLPVILNTAYTQYRESFMSWAADAYVVKSSDLTELKAKVKDLIAK